MQIRNRDYFIMFISEMIRTFIRTTIIATAIGLIIKLLFHL